MINGQNEDTVVALIWQNFAEQGVREIQEYFGSDIHVSQSFKFVGSDQSAPILPILPRPFLPLNPERVGARTSIYQVYQ